MRQALDSNKKVTFEGGATPSHMGLAPHIGGEAEVALF